jgi:hypothetical protein
MVKKQEKFKEYACAFKNEAECEEDMEEDALKMDEAESEFFKDDELYE